MNRLAITKIMLGQKEYTAYIALNKQRDFIDFQLFEAEERSLLGRIYIARVEHVLPNIQAVFVRITPGQKCYLPLEETADGFFTRKQSDSKMVSEGDELLVQVTKEAVKTKEPVVSTHLTLAGRYAVLTTGNTALSVSKKLPEESRVRRKELLEKICAGHGGEGYGIVLRTNSSQAGEEELTEDLLSLVGQYRTLCGTCRHLSVFTEVYRNLPGYIRRLQAVRNFSFCDGTAETGGETCAVGAGYDGIYTDDIGIYEQIRTMLPYLEERKLLHLYDDPQVSLSTLYHIRGNIDRLLSRKVWLPSGANLVIDRVEAMTVIDVNTAKNLKVPRGASARMETFLRVNKEAAAEVARQLRLRNISGIIVVDFINMEEAAERELVRFLEAELAQDVVPCRFVDMTKLGLAELTRKKVHKSLAEILEQ